MLIAVLIVNLFVSFIIIIIIILFAQYAEMNSKICNVPDRKANSFSSNNCP